MKAAALTGLRKAEIVDRPKPSPGAGEVLIRVTHVGICGSDVHYWSKGRIGDAVVPHPYVVGHEVSGVVEELGSGIEESGLEPGMQVAVEPGIPCGQCPACMDGMPHCCPHVRFFGTPPVEGAFCEFVCSVPRCLEPLPDGISLEAASVVEPLGVGVHAVNISTLKPGMKAGVFGTGPVGLMTLQTARAGGATPLYATDIRESRLEAARSMGAEKAVNAEEEDAAGIILRETGGLDVAFEAAGDPAAVHDAIRSLRHGGFLVIIGIPDPGPSDIDFHAARRKELSIIFSRRSNFETGQCIRLLRKKLVTTDGIVTHRFPLERIQEAFELVDSYGDGVIKAMIEVARG